MRTCFCRSSYSAAAAEGGKHKSDFGLEEKSIEAICSRSQLYDQRGVCLPEHISELHYVGPGGASTRLGKGGLCAEDSHRYK